VDYLKVKNCTSEIALSSEGDLRSPCTEYFQRDQRLFCSYRAENVPARKTVVRKTIVLSGVRCDSKKNKKRKTVFQTQTNKVLEFAFLFQHCFIKKFSFFFFILSLAALQVSLFLTHGLRSLVDPLQ
jgi:hypothetical protein